MLPYHHIMPLCFTLILPMYLGVPVILLTEISSASLLKTLQENVVTVILGVPRVWEMLDKAIMTKINQSSVAKFMFKLASKTNSMSIRKMLFSKVHKQFGGHIRLMVSGGAKIDKNILEDFRTMGFRAIQGYGMTETAPIITFNVPGRERSDSAGEVIPNVEVKIADDGEVLVKGKNVMKGYYKNEAATKEAFDAEGWFHTGDLGKMDGKYLIIIGRKKEMIVLPNGKNIDPNDVEAEIIKNTDLIKEIEAFSKALYDFQCLENELISQNKFKPYYSEHGILKRVDYSGDILDEEAFLIFYGLLFDMIELNPNAEELTDEEIKILLKEAIKTKEFKETLKIMGEN